MCKRLLLLAVVLLLAGAPNAFAAVGIFDFSEDIGNPGGTGGTRYVATDEYLILGGGSDIWAEADQFHYAFKTLTGPGTIAARVESLTNTDTYAKAAVMIRETLDADSKYSLVAVTPGAGVLAE